MATAGATVLLRAAAVARGVPVVVLVELAEPRDAPVTSASAAPRSADWASVPPRTASAATSSAACVRRILATGLQQMPPSCKAGKRSERRCVSAAGQVPSITHCAARVTATCGARRPRRGAAAAAGRKRAPVVMAAGAAVKSGAP